MNTHAMRGRFLEWVAVVQRHKDERVHLHLVVVCKEDVRTGFNFSAVRMRDYSSASRYLREEWRFWREHAPKYGFGRMELLPMRTTVGQFAHYVARYLSRKGGTRREEKGARLVRYSKGFVRVVAGRFSWLADKWRVERVAKNQAAAFASFGVRGEEHMRMEYGPGWRRYFNRLFYADPDTFMTVRDVTERCLEFHAGVVFALAVAWREWDERAERLRELREGGGGFQALEIPEGAQLVAPSGYFARVARAGGWG
jgi:hypothetical protein